MTNITTLKNKITEIENSITEDMSKEDIYDQLIIAYSLQKDVIASKEDPTIEIKDDNSDTIITGLKTQLKNAEEKIQQLDLANEKLFIEVEALTEHLRDAEEQVRVLTHWQDGANLEGEQLKAEKEKLFETTIQLQNELNKKDTDISTCITLIGDLRQNTNSTIDTLTNNISMIEQYFAE